jgi:transposase
MFVRVQRSGKRTYLLIVENEWAAGKVRQKVLHRLGRLDILQKTGKLDALMLSMQRFSQKFAVLGATQNAHAQTGQSCKIGPALIFERLWQQIGIGKVLSGLLGKRKFSFSVERTVFLTVLHRLFCSGSDRAAAKWKADYRIKGVEDIELHQIYRAMGWLGQPLGANKQFGATPFAPRCTKDEIEEQLFKLRRDLFAGLDLVFFDTTSIYFEGAGGETIGQNGHSKDHRPDLKQMVVGMILDNQGNPLCSEMWPGNVTDVKTLVPVVDRLKTRFGVCNVCIVADRGMISEETIREIERRGWKYVLGVRMRKSKEVKDKVLSQPGRYQQVFGKSKDSKSPSPLKVKEVSIGSKRYIVCLNEDQVAKDKVDREAIVESLREALKRGDKSLIGNKGYRRFIAGRGQRFVIDEQKVMQEARYDGKWVLTTNTNLSAKATALKYKQLWMVESIFRSMKSLLETRPIFHKCDATIRGHVFCSFLALLLRKELENRLEQKDFGVEWADVIRDLDNLIEMEITVSDKRYTIRSDTAGTIAKVFGACGVALPPILSQC